MSEFLNRFIIHFVSLKEGVHHYDYVITDKFFEKFELSEISNGHLEVDIILEKHTSMLELRFDIEGFVMIPCDLCLEEFEMSIKSSNKMYVKFGNDYTEVADDIIMLPRNADEINVAQFIYEYINLAIPIRRVHPLDENGEATCNPEMIRLLNELKPNNSDN